MFFLQQTQTLLWQARRAPWSSKRGHWIYNPLKTLSAIWVLTRALGVGAGPGLRVPVKHLFICTLSFFAAVKFDLSDRMVKLDGVSCVVTNILHMSEHIFV